MEEKNINRSISKSKKDSSKKSSKSNKVNKFSNTSIDSSKYDDMYLEIKNNKFNIVIVAFLSFLVVLSFYLQYQYELKRRMHSSSEEYDDEQKYYDILGVNEASSASDINKSFKELAKIWHPDKNPNCESCVEKFKLISKAKEVVLSNLNNNSSNEQRTSKGTFSSSPFYLTTNNYHKLVEESNDFWVICIYEDQKGSSYNKYVADAFDEVHLKYKNIIKFGIIDVLKNYNLIHFLPYKFQFYPNIITIKHGESELFENLDMFNVNTLTSFIDRSYTNKVHLIDDYSINNLIKKYENNDLIDINSYFKYKVNNEELSNIFDLSFFVLSPKNNIELITKDYANVYEKHIKVYQNDLGFYDKSLRLFNSKGDRRVFIGLNKVVKNKENNLYKYYLKKEIVKIPVYFSPTVDLNNKLQRSFIFAKSLIIPNIYKDNYSRHCINKIIMDNEEIGSNLEREETTRINMCVIIIDHSNDESSGDFNKELSYIINNKFFKRLEEEKSKNNSKNRNKDKDTNSDLLASEEYVIRINYGRTNIDYSPELKTLYNKYVNSQDNNSLSSFKLEGLKKHIFIINDTFEKFIFKSFNSIENMYDYLDYLDNGDYYQDYDFAFKHFAEFDVKNVSDLFYKERYFSVSKTLINPFYSMMQGGNVLLYILLIVANLFALKVNNTVSNFNKN